MPLDDEERTPAAGPRLRQQPIGGLVVEMGERGPARPGQHCALNDAVVNERVVHDHVVAAQEMADHGDVGRMAADQDDAVLGAVQTGQRPLELAVHRPLARDRAARRDRGAVAVDRRLGRRGDLGMTVEADIVVGGEIDVAAPVDRGFGAGDPLVDAKERVGDAEKIRGLADHSDLFEPVELGHLDPRSRLGCASIGDRRPLRRRRGQPVEQLGLCLGRQTEEVAPLAQGAIPPPPASLQPTKRSPPPHRPRSAPPARPHRRPWAASTRRRRAAPRSMRR